VRRYNDLKFKNYEIINYFNDYNPGLQWWVNMLSKYFYDKIPGE
jgi:hypothetical protein